MYLFKVFLVDENGRYYTDPSHATETIPKRTYWEVGKLNRVREHPVRCAVGLHGYTTTYNLGVTYWGRDRVAVGIVRGEGIFTGMTSALRGVDDKLAFQGMTLMEIVIPAILQGDLGEDVERKGPIVRQLEEAMKKYRKGDIFNA